MDIDSDSELSAMKRKVEALQASLASLSSSISKLSSSSRGIPSDEDFHFYYNFNEFKMPVKEIVKNTESALKNIGSRSGLWGKNLNFPDELDEAYDWLVNFNDEIFERFDSSVDEFQRVRRVEEETGNKASAMEDDDGFQLVSGRKKKGISRNLEKDDGDKTGSSSASSSVRTVSRDARTTSSRPRVPFHIPSITRPQTEFKIVVDNSNELFEHVWLQKTEDGSRVIHPLENFSALDFVDRHNEDVELVKPPPLGSTPFKLVEEVKDLKDLAAKLREVNEFAVDLEHNHYRSFQGLTCLMQISTRFEDFVVDTLKLHAHIGPHLREVFKDPSKKKVMHGADRDIEWLQRDFGIYVCNLFDTGQASRVLKLERNSLEYLLHHFCGVTANKEYQNADWRLRPIPDEMLKYAREDTHYLLHIYDLMKVQLHEASSSPESVDALLLEVYKRSYDVCMQLYKKEILTDTSYLHIYGLQGADFDSQQLSVVAGLCEWRDNVARAEDESTGFILPNKTLLDIARQMPLSAGKLRRLVSSKHPYVERNLGSVVNVIKSSIKNASSFECVAEELQKARTEMVPAQDTVVADEPESLLTADSPTDDGPVSVQKCTTLEIMNSDSTKSGDCTSILHVDEPMEVSTNTVECGASRQINLLASSHGVGELKEEQNGHPVELPQEKFIPTGQMGGANIKVSEATVQVLKKPNRAFGALLGSSASKRKLGSDSKVEKIKSSVTLPFHSFSEKKTEPLPKEKTTTIQPTLDNKEEIPALEDVISLDNNPSSPHESPNLEEDKPMSLSELSSSFQDCLQSMNEKRNNKKVEESESNLEVKPFDYETAREKMTFGVRREEREIKGEEEEGGQKKNVKERRRNNNNRGSKDEVATGFQPARRRMAFPPSGNRSATFRED